MQVKGNNKYTWFSNGKQLQFSGLVSKRKQVLQTKTFVLFLHLSCDHKQLRLFADVQLVIKHDQK